jgi:hypothetical protein
MRIEGRALRAKGFNEPDKVDSLLLRAVLNVRDTLSAGHSCRAVVQQNDRQRMPLMDGFDQGRDSSVEER